AIAIALGRFDDGTLFADLARRVAIPSTLQDAALRGEVRRYLAEEIAPTLERLGYACALHDNPDSADTSGAPLLLALRHEDDARPTVLTYAHGDVVRGQDERWHAGRGPWTLHAEGERWYGRGTADNKGQHTVNLAALAAVLETRGRLGFNSVVLMEGSEEVGSPGLRAFAEAQAAALAADLLIASDGPRLTPERPTLFLGSRGAMNFRLRVRLREGAHHSGNWGGLIANAGTRLANAIAALIGPKGEIRVPALKPAAIPDEVREALVGCTVGAGPDGPAVEPDWGEPGLSPAERVFGWNALEVLAFRTGDPDAPVNAIPPAAEAVCQIRFTVDREPDSFLPAIRSHLDKHGFTDVEAVQDAGDFTMRASRLSPRHPWVRWAAASIERSTGKLPMVLPNIGGSLPNDIFAELLGLPTLWVPHSYAGCSQHAPDEHALAPVLREGLQAMTGLFWDLGELSGRAPEGEAAD
ncbi:MAG TPA: M20 family metallopeptidase, partial [Alphaproteobacteria bacterium]|nr:M20 family metallopeptidase [Alphaproteobacteria bacterium]